MLTLHNVSVRMDEKDILKDVSFQLRPNRLTVLVGRNGSGKSTLLSCVNQQTPYSGAITVEGKEYSRLPARQRAKTVAILPQSLPAPQISLWEMTAFGRNPYLDFTGRLTQSDQEIIDKALADAKSTELAGRYVNTLSGGERQRGALAMILAQDTPIMLLDEPTAHMDLAYEARFLELLSQLKGKKTILIVLHDLNLAAQYADDILVLDGGKLVFSGTREACLKEEILEKTFQLRRFRISDGDRQRFFFAAK